MLRGLLLRVDVPDAQSCPMALEQAPRLDTILDACDGALCVELVPGTSWRIVGDQAFGSGTLVFYEVPGVPCTVNLKITKDVSGQQDLLAELE